MGKIASCCNCEDKPKFSVLDPMVCAHMLLSKLNVRTVESKQDLTVFRFTLLRGQIPGSCDNDRGIGHFRSSWSEALVATRGGRVGGWKSTVGRQLVGRSYLGSIADPQSWFSTSAERWVYSGWGQVHIPPKMISHVLHAQEVADTISYVPKVEPYRLLGSAFRKVPMPMLWDVVGNFGFNSC